MQLGSVKFLRVIIFSGWNCHFLVRGGSTSFRTMKNYLQSSGVILLKDQECLVGFCSSSVLDPLTRCSIQDTLRDVHDG